MTQPILIKAYGGFKPVPKNLYEDFQHILAQAFPSENASVSFEGDMCKLAFEGIYFPLEEILLAIQNNATSLTIGRLDVLDLENWKLYRHEIKDNILSKHANGLNNVLDYSGF